MRYFITLIGAAVVCFTVHTARAESLEVVEKKISEQMAKHKSVEMKSKMKMDLSNEGMSEKSMTESAIVYAKKGDKWLSRVDAKTTGTRKLGECRRKNSIRSRSPSWTANTCIASTNPPRASRR